MTSRVALLVVGCVGACAGAPPSRGASASRGAPASTVAPPVVSPPPAASAAASASAPASAVARPPVALPPTVAPPPVASGPSPFHVVVENATDLVVEPGPTQFIHQRRGTTVARVDGASIVLEKSLTRAVQKAAKKVTGSLWFVSGHWPDEVYVSIQGTNPGPPSFSTFRAGALHAAGRAGSGLGSVEAVGALGGRPLFVIEDEPSPDQPFVFFDVRKRPTIPVEDVQTPLVVDPSADGTLYFADSVSSTLRRHPGGGRVNVGSSVRQIAAVSASVAFVLTHDKKLLRVEADKASLMQPPLARVDAIDAQPDGTLWAISDDKSYRRSPSGVWEQVPLSEGVGEVLVVSDADVWLVGATKIFRTIAPPAAPTTWVY
ncbi:MAG: hypothetical protein H6717_23200 [Polyangiaceae bacterium]|nr:hypothetical protein [Polyangiaceae bacterium]